MRHREPGAEPLDRRGAVERRELQPQGAVLARGAAPNVRPRPGPVAGPGGDDRDVLDKAPDSGSSTGPASRSRRCATAGSRSVSRTGACRTCRPQSRPFDHMRASAVNVFQGAPWIPWSSRWKASSPDSSVHSRLAQVPVEGVCGTGHPIVASRLFHVAGCVRLMFGNTCPGSPSRAPHATSSSDSLQNGSLPRRNAKPVSHRHDRNAKMLCKPFDCPGPVLDGFDDRFHRHRQIIREFVCFRFLPCRESTVLRRAHPTRGAFEALQKTVCLLPWQPCGGDPSDCLPLAKNGWLHGRRCRLPGLRPSGGPGPQGVPVDPQGSLPGCRTCRAGAASARRFG